MRPARWMLPTSGRPSKAMSLASRPGFSGCRASWSRLCRCRDAPVRTGPLQLRRSPRGHQDLGPAASWGGPSAFLVCSIRAAEAQRGAHNPTSAASGRSSTGRAPVSKTGGWGFDSLRPCESWKVLRAPGPRPGREASEQRGTGLTVTWPWDTSPDPDPSDGEWGRIR